MLFQIIFHTFASKISSTMKYITYKTKKEEKLKELAEQFQTSPELIKKANPKAKIFTSFPWGYEVVSYDEILKIPVPDESTIEDETHSFKTDEFIPIARYRCSQQNTTKALNEVQFSAEIKTEYLLSLLKRDTAYYHVKLKDYVYSVSPKEVELSFELIRELELVRNNIKFTQDEKERITIYNSNEILTDWEYCKKNIIPKVSFFVILQEKVPDVASDFLIKGDEEFLYTDRIVNVLRQNIFFHILWKSMLDSSEPFSFKQFSQIFPDFIFNIDVRKDLIRNNNGSKTCKLKGVLNTNNIPIEDLVKKYDEVYKPLLKFSFTEFNFIYNITYTIDSKGVLTEASALVYEFIKNNFEIITQFKLNKVDL